MSDRNSAVDSGPESGPEIHLYRTQTQPTQPCPRHGKSHEVNKPQEVEDAPTESQPSDSNNTKTVAFHSSPLVSGTTLSSPPGNDNQHIASPKPADAVQLATLELMHGRQLYITLTCLCTGLLLSSLETTIVATALVSLTSTLGGFDRSSWVATAYLVTYTGFLVIFARFSDIFGRKWVLCFAIVLFTLFSLACGLAQTMDQLIVFRAFQGIGGAGLYSMAMSVMAEITPLEYIGVMSGLMGSTFALASLLGPVLGGIIVSRSTWRWIFLLNVPPGAIMLALVLFTFPRNGRQINVRAKFAMCRNLDLPGMVLSVAGIVLVVYALEQGGRQRPWDSPQIVVGFVLGTAFLLAFAGWEWILARGRRFTQMVPLFPGHLLTRRVPGFAILTAFFVGFPFMIAIFFIPQRFQVQNGLSAADAGVRMLALLTLSATGAGLGGIIASRRNVSWYLLVGSIALQLVGLGLMSTLPTEMGPVKAAQYGYQAVLGLGFGLSLSSLAIVARLEVEPEDVGVTFGIVTQIRVLGGLVGIALAQEMLTARVASDLIEVFGVDKVEALLQSHEAWAAFTPEETAAAAHSYGEAFNVQHLVALAFAVAGLIACLGTFRRKPVQFSEKRGSLGAMRRERAAAGGSSGGSSDGVVETNAVAEEVKVEV